MKYEILDYGALCELATFTINSKNADYDDFGDKYDNDTENAEDYGCGDMRFFPKPAAEEILTKYNISLDEYNILTKELEDKLSFGSCGWCV